MHNDDVEKLLHGEEYASRFEREQSRKRLSRLCGRVSIPDDALVLDIGCGSGLWIDACGSFRYQYVGVDFSEPFIQIAKQKFSGMENVEFQCGDVAQCLSTLPQRPNVALAMDISEHVDDERWLLLLQQVRSALAPGGVMYIHTPNANYILEIMKANGVFLKQFPEHIAVRTKKQNEVLLKEAGFSVVKSTLLPHYNWLGYFHGLSYLPFLGKFFAARIFIEAKV